jgi:NAD(P)-dependent dehydrogenase (short-subunit alcohol dehydrogenase family)
MLTLSTSEAVAAGKEEAMGDTPGAKRVVVTGGNAGLGYECAKGIAGAGPEWRVVLAVRSHEKGERAARAIAEETGNPNVEAMGLDLASLASVRSFARELARRNDLLPLQALVCNAGLQVVSGTTYTENGLEESFGVNHLAHFLLVNLLLRQLEAPARIVFVSSGTHDPERRTGMPAPRYRARGRWRTRKGTPTPMRGARAPAKSGGGATPPPSCAMPCAPTSSTGACARGPEYPRGPDRRERLRPGRRARHRPGA